MSNFAQGDLSTKMHLESSSWHGVNYIAVSGWKLAGFISHVHRSGTGFFWVGVMAVFLPFCPLGPCMN